MKSPISQSSPTSWRIRLGYGLILLMGIWSFQALAIPAVYYQSHHEKVVTGPAQPGGASQQGKQSKPQKEVYGSQKQK